MVIKKITTVMVLNLFAFFLIQAQENIGGTTTQIRSPVKHEDGSVSFHLHAPNAQTVQLVGNWMASSPDSVIVMSQDARGVWSATVDSLPSDLFLYYFVLDGLRINDPSNVYQIRDVSQVFNYFITEGEPADFFKTQDVPHGTLVKLWYPSQIEGESRRMTVYLPPGYHEQHADYPVLYLLHGMGGDEEAWPTLGRVSQIMDNLVAKGQIAPMLVVMPNGHTSNQAAPGYSARGEYPIEFRTPDVGSGVMESTFMEVVDFIENSFRVKKDKKHRALAGLSMGGSHSLFIAAANSDVFDYIGLFSAAFRLTDQAGLNIYDEFGKNLERQKKQGYQLYWIGMGTDDFLYQTGVDYRNRLDRLGMEYMYHESEGGHTWSNWRKYLIEFSRLLFKD